MGLYLLSHLPVRDVHTTSGMNDGQWRSIAVNRCHFCWLPIELVAGPVLSAACPRLTTPPSQRPRLQVVVLCSLRCLEGLADEGGDEAGDHSWLVCRCQHPHCHMEVFRWSSTVCSGAASSSACRRRLRERSTAASQRDDRVAGASARCPGPGRSHLLRHMKTIELPCSLLLLEQPLSLEIEVQDYCRRSN